MPYERFNKPSNTTLIEELDARPQQSTDKYIRHNHQLPVESGMAHREHFQQQENFMYEPQSLQSLQSFQSFQPTQPMLLPPAPSSMPSLSPSSMPSLPSFSSSSCSCPDVYMHIVNCPVCKRMYGQESKSSAVYICIIIILLVFCVLLFRKAFP